LLVSAIDPQPVLWISSVIGVRGPVAPPAWRGRSYANGFVARSMAHTVLPRKVVQALLSAGVTTEIIDRVHSLPNSCAPFTPRRTVGQPRLYPSGVERDRAYRARRKERDKIAGKKLRVRFLKGRLIEAARGNVELKAALEPIRRGSDVSIPTKAPL
jgi:hypothetical protein